MKGRLLMTGKDLVKLLKEHGWQIDRVHGSHHVMKKNNKTEIIPVHSTDIPAGLLNAVLKRTGLK
jgi:predicted RNA binding protein YcfA (HicA-like mRNA interferase family)